MTSCLNHVSNLKSYRPRSLILYSSLCQRLQPTVPGSVEFGDADDAPWEVRILHDSAQKLWQYMAIYGNIIGDHELWLRPSTIEPTVDYWLVYLGSKTFMWRNKIWEWCTARASYGSEVNKDLDRLRRNQQMPSMGQQCDVTILQVYPRVKPEIPMVCRSFRLCSQLFNDNFGVYSEFLHSGFFAVRSPRRKVGTKVFCPVEHVGESIRMYETLWVGSFLLWVGMPSQDGYEVYLGTCTPKIRRRILRMTVGSMASFLSEISSCFCFSSLKNLKFRRKLMTFWKIPSFEMDDNWG